MKTVTAKSLPNPRHELYARLRAKGANMNKAGIAAGFAQGSSTASELEKDPDVQARIDEIKLEISDQREATREAAREAGRQIGREIGYGKGWVITKLAENAEMARQDGDYKESNAALKLIGDELGMFDGGSAAPEEDDAGVPTYDMDAIDALTKAGIGDQSASQTKSEVRMVDPDLALKLIDGHGAAANRMRESRMMQTGSETDVHLTDDEDDTAWMTPPDMADEDQVSEPEPGVDPETQWTPIDPKTSPEDIIAMATGKKPRPAPYVPTVRDDPEPLHPDDLLKMAAELTPPEPAPAPSAPTDDRPRRRSQS